MKNFLLSLTFLFSFFVQENSYSQMFWNQAASFNGSTSSYLSVPHSPALGITGSFTLEAWVCPDLNMVNNRAIFGKSGMYGGTSQYGLRVTATGRVQIVTNGTARFLSKTTTLLPVNTWSHICGTYDSLSNTMSVYVNGVLDSTGTPAGPLVSPLVTVDSLFVGIGGSLNGFKGYIDEARIWNRALTATEVSRYYRSTLSASSGPFKNLIYSLTFQDNESQGVDFSLTDWTHNSADANNRGATAVDLSNRPSTTIFLSDCFNNSGVGGSKNYAAAPDHVNLSPTTEITMELWYSGDETANRIIMQKGPGASEDANYGIGKQNGGAYAIINGFKLLDLDLELTGTTWHHIAFTYRASTGEYHFYFDGKKHTTGFYAGGNIIDGTDSLYIGASQGTTDVFARVDEVRISNRVKSYEEICDNMFKSIDASNDPPGLDAIYSFDGTLEPSVDAAPRLTFNNNANFAQCTNPDLHPAPILRNDPQNFYEGFVMKQVTKDIPTLGSMAEDTLRLINGQTISDINVFIGMEHRRSSDLRVFLVSPDNDVIQLFNHDTSVSRAITTVFDDNADSSLGKSYVSYIPEIKPSSSINSILSGKNSNGFWKLRIIDDVAANSGKLYGWGIQVNNTVAKPYVMNVSALIQGFYDSLTNNTVRDTMRFRLRESTAPYSLIESKRNYFSMIGFNSIEWNSVSSGVPMYIQLTHRNSLETWSSQTVEFDPFTRQAIYDFRDTQLNTYGSNSLQLDTSPLRFGNYTGDPNQDGVVNLTDITTVYNGSTVFLTGYVLADVNGNSTVNLADLVLTYNNAQNFVSSEHP